MLLATAAPPQLEEAEVLITPCTQELPQTEAKQTAYDHTAREWQSRDGDTGGLAPRPGLLPGILRMGKKVFADELKS